MFGNTRCTPMVALPVARSGATQVVLLGRASSPLGLGGAGCGGGGSCEGGGVSGPPSPLEQPVISTRVATVIPRRRAFLTWSRYSVFIMSARTLACCRHNRKEQAVWTPAPSLLTYRRTITRLATSEACVVIPLTRRVRSRVGLQHSGNGLRHPARGGLRRQRR